MAKGLAIEQGGSDQRPGRGGARRSLARLLVALALTLGVVLGWTAFAGGQQPYETYESRVTADGPVALFRFDDPKGSTTIADPVGSFTATNNGITLGLEGPFGGSASGSPAGSEYATLPGDPLEGAREWTAEAWVYWTGTSSYKEPV